MLARKSLVLFPRAYRLPVSLGRRYTMPPPDLGVKRKTEDAPVSPPPLKKTVKSNTTKNAVANFFTPVSQKAKEATTWTERGPDDEKPATLLVARYQSQPVQGKEKGHEARNALEGRRKIAAFDLDSTLITTASGKTHAGSASDWKWWDSSVPDKLRALHREQGYHVVILSNQGGITLHADAKSKAPKAQGQKRLGEFKQKCNAVLATLDLPVTIYAATGRDLYRKPRTGMWKELLDDLDLPEDKVDLEESFFVGDAGGRTASSGHQNQNQDQAKTMSKDFSCSDRNFAHNVGIRYWTPEEYFLGERSRDFAREFDLAHFPYQQDGNAPATSSQTLFEKKNDQDIVLFCGPPGAGKSTFYWTVLKPLGYRRVNQDTLGSREKCLQAARQMLAEGESVTVDNTNADPGTRAVWIGLARDAKVPIRCVWFSTPIVVCEHNDAVRSLNKELNPESRQGLPKLAFNGFISRFREPKVNEGFQDVTPIEFKFRGTKEEFVIWSRYWI